MIVLAAVLCVFVVIMLLPVGGSVVYDENGAVVKILVGAIRIQVLPRTKPAKSKNDKKPKQAKPKKEKKKSEEVPAEAAAKKGGKLPMLLDFVQLGIRFLGSFRRKLLIRELKLYVTYGGDDPAKAAVSYGNSCAAAHGILPLLHQIFHIRKQDVRLIFDETSDTMKIYAQAALSIRIGQVLALAVRYGVQALQILLKHKSKTNEEKAVSK